MKRIKYTIIDSSGIVQSFILYEGQVPTYLGQYTPMPNGVSGVLIRIELILEANAQNTIDMTTP
jgi:hypothetical protein